MQLVGSMFLDSDEGGRRHGWRIRRQLRGEPTVGERVRALRTITSVEVPGHYPPSAQIVVDRRDYDGAEGEGEWEL
jgi:hypothetical protein